MSAAGPAAIVSAGLITAKAKQQHGMEGQPAAVVFTLLGHVMPGWRQRFTHPAPPLGIYRLSSLPPFPPLSLAFPEAGPVGVPSLPPPSARPRLPRLRLAAAAVGGPR